MFMKFFNKIKLKIKLYRVFQVIIICAAFIVLVSPTKSVIIFEEKKETTDQTIINKMSDKQYSKLIDKLVQLENERQSIVKKRGY
jgi:hypothetical protein